MQRRLTETAARLRSFAGAAEVVAIWSGQAASPRTIARIAEEAGRELVENRRCLVDDFTHHRRGPEGPDPLHACVAVFVDGGRVQVRDEPGGPGVRGQCWREDKIARLQAMESEASDVDPCPELPACFLTSSVRHNLYLAVREALNNAVKHSGARDVQISLRVGEETLTLTVADNGCGFDAGANAAATSGRNGLRNMRERFNIGYDLAVAGVSNKDSVARSLPQLAKFLAFPTTIFLDKKGNVRKIHTGFAGPGTGKYYQEEVASFNREVDKLLKE